MTTTTFALGGDLTVNRLGFGAMRLPMSTFDGPTRTPENGIAVLRRAIELGVNHIDTAAFYARGDVRANDLIREALAPYPDDLVIATKVGPLPGPDGHPSVQATPDQLRALVEADLTALGVDRLDVVNLRVGGMSGPGGESVAERFAALAALREEGLIRHLGVSNIDAAQLAEARAIAPVVCVQNPYADDLALLAECEAAGIAYVPFFLLGGGRTPWTRPAWKRSPPAWAQRPPRSSWPCSWPRPRPCSPSPARATSPTWRRTWPPATWS